MGKREEGERERVLLGCLETKINYCNAVRVLELFNHEEFIITKLKLHKPPPPLPFLSAFDSLRPDRQGRTTMYRYFF